MGKQSGLLNYSRFENVIKNFMEKKMNEMQKEHASRGKTMSREEIGKEMAKKKIEIALEIQNKIK